ncbi:MAG: hypothetical protein GEU98_25275 [Pseudonocardiaceae bacterium]|nr:hypothetical protein [Pseudonocardiaceae bacterium]
MPIKPAGSPFDEELRSEYVTSDALLELLTEAVAGSESFSVNAEWSSGHVAKDISDESELDGIESPEQLSRLTVSARMVDGSSFYFRPIDALFAPHLTGDRGTAVERARSLAARWHALPARKAGLRRFRRILSIVIFLGWLALGTALIVRLEDELPVWAVAAIGAGAVGVAAGLSHLLPGSDRLLSRGGQVAGGAPDWWKDWRGLVPATLTVLSIAAAAFVLFGTGG